MGLSARRRLRVEEDTELNMVPIMNMFMVLIPFLLMSATFFHIKAINTSVPVHAESSVENKSPETKLVVTLVLELKKNQVHISAFSSNVDTNALAAIEKTIAKPNGGQISADLIATHLQQIKDRYPTSDTMILIPDEGISYGEIIQAMDCARRHHEDSLFPNVVLAASLG